jgi:hypothetical protein
VRGRRWQSSAGMAGAAFAAVAIALSPRVSFERTSHASAEPGGRDDTSVPEIAFNRVIRPILSENCFKCHGPDSAARKGGLRLDTFEGATAQLPDGRAAIVPGDPASSVLLQRVASHDPDARMPPPSEGKTVTAAQMESLRGWIEEGAPWEAHWSFIPPVRPQPPQAVNDGWSRSELDRFVFDRLLREGLTPSPEASREALLRRVSLDLTGLPPSPEAIEAFLADRSPDAYERVVDWLLASPSYGEHMARYWLDAARYGDTHGLHLDNRRSMWRWRDWVIDAFNRNLPFDQFTVEQLAGDLLPQPTVEQLIASGFNRNNVSTSEGGAIDEEYYVKYAVDRVATTSTVWMGLTTECAECHDHKFDPISQKEFYQLFAFFNNTAENAMDGNRHDPPPSVRAPTPEQSRELARLMAAAEELRSQLEGPMPEVDLAQASWEAEWRNRAPRRWHSPRVIDARSAGGATLSILDDGSVLASGTNPARDVHEFDLAGPIDLIGVIRVEAITHESLPFSGAGRADNANFVLSEAEVEIIGPDGVVRQAVPFVAAVADHEQMNGPFLAAYSIDGVVNDTNGWAVEGYERRENRTLDLLLRSEMNLGEHETLRVRLRYESMFPGHAIGRVRITTSGDEALRDSLLPVVLGPWHVAGPFAAANANAAHDTAFGPEADPSRFDPGETFADGAISWVARPDLADGAVQLLTGDIGATYLARTFEATSPRRVELALGSDDSIIVWLNGRRVHENRVARPAAVDQDRVVVDLPEGVGVILMKIANFGGGHAFAFRIAREFEQREFAEVTDLLATPIETLAESERSRIRRYFRMHHSAEARALMSELAAAEAAGDAFEASLPISLVMRERDASMARTTHVLFRGNYDQPREAVEPAVPAALPPLSTDMPRNRLGLARWLVDSAHPLTARVTVNRLWQQVFGEGLVRTVGDFGSQGEWPTHPELLDFLAIEFVESGWDVKAFMRLLVTSAAYRQSSRVSPELLQRDPENRLLARGPRHRLDAEAIRDLALASSGLLVDRIGGESVRIYQPSGLWEAVAYPSSDTAKFAADSGDALYRRSLYTFWKRTSPPPVFTTFDAPSRETCTVDRPRTNTPLQALVLMNGTQFVEASRVMAERVLAARSSDAERVTFLFQLVLGRAPDREEADVLAGLLRSQRARFAANRQAAEALLTVGEAPRDASLEPAEVAAWATVCHAVLMLDEAITKG